MSCVHFSLGTQRLSELTPEHLHEPQIPPYKEKIDEPIKLKKAR